MEIHRNFVPLPFGMKNVFTGISALLLVIWYSLSVIGFDVHTCSGSGETYIATVIGGTECEDIHPEHVKKPCPCCHHHAENHCEDNGQSVSKKPCCSDDWQMIVLTGVRVADERMVMTGNTEQIVSTYPALISENIDSGFIPTGRWAFPKPDPGNIIPQNFQKVYSIWRI